jgi:hypothetical protein
MTPEAMDRSYEMSASLQERNQLPDWMYSPPTPERAKLLEPGPDGKPPADGTEVVRCGDALYDRIVLYRLHEYAPPAIFEKAGPIMSGYLRWQWGVTFPRVGRPSTDESPENRGRRAELLALAERCAAAGTSAVVERRRAWRLIDWKVRTKTAALLELAGWGEYAAAYRALPPIAGPTLPRGAASIFRAVERETDKASTAALKGRRPYKRDRASDRADHGRVARLWGADDRADRIGLAVRNAFPEIFRRHIRDDDVPQRERTDLGRALQAGGYARICIDYDPRISDAKVTRTLAEITGSAGTLIDEIIAMGAQRAA